jgi:hypothetical protein
MFAIGTLKTVMELSFFEGYVVCGKIPYLETCCVGRFF